MVENILLGLETGLKTVESDIVNLVSFVDNVYLKGLIILVAFFIISKAVVWISEKILLKLASKTTTKVDDLIIEHTNKPISWILFFLGLRFALLPLTIQVFLETILVRFIYSATLYFFISAVIEVFSIITEHWGKLLTARSKSTMDDHLLDLAYKTIRILLIVVGFLFILDLWGFKIGPLITGLGIGGLAVAFALQPTLANIFGGVTLILDKTISVGDTVEIDQYSGKILDIGIRSTKIKTWDNEVVIMSNGKLVNADIKNKTKPDLNIRVVVPFSIAYGSDVVKAKKIVMNLIKEVDGVISDPAPWIWFTEMADSSLNLKAHFFVDDLGKKWPAVDFINTNIHAAFKKAKIEIPFPQMDVHMKRR